MKVDAVVFDYFGTLASEATSGAGAPAWWTTLRDTVAEAGGAISDEAWARFSLLPEDHAEHSVNEDAYRAWSQGRLSELLASCGLAADAQAEIHTTVMRERGARTFTAFAEALKVVEQLRDMRVRVGVCSNWDWDLELQLRSNGLLGLVDFVVCSARVGYRKPHPAIFDRLAEAAGTSRSRTIFVGDEWQADIAGSAAAGLKPIHVFRGGPCDVTGHDGIECVGDLRGVVAAVRGAR